MAPGGLLGWEGGSSWSRPDWCSVFGCRALIISCWTLVYVSCRSFSVIIGTSRSGACGALRLGHLVRRRGKALDGAEIEGVPVLSEVGGGAGVPVGALALMTWASRVV